jgi:arginyl-tRNA synthetase
MIGLGALKYFLLKVDPKKRMVFNPEESIDFNGHSASFIQFSHARTSSIIRSARQMNLDADWQELSSLQPLERDVIVALAAYPGRVKEAGDEYSPAVISQYAYDLAKTYSRFFTEHSIINAETETQKRFRVALTGQTARMIRKSMALLGIGVPERM